MAVEHIKWVQTYKAPGGLPGHSKGCVLLATVLFELDSLVFISGVL